MLNRAAPTATVHRQSPRLVIALAGLAAGLIACTGAPAASSPVASPTPGSTAAPSSAPPSPAASPRPSSPILTPLPSTGPATPSPAAGAIEHPTGATDVVLRMDQGGGHMIFGYALTQAPTFTLYGDGTFILRQSMDPERAEASDGFPRFLHGRMTEEYVQALLRHALGGGRLLNAREEVYFSNNCADCGTTTFTINAAGISKVVTVDALNQVEETGPDAVDRRGFAQLAQTLAELETDARSGELGEVVIYDPDHYRVLLFEAFGDPVEEPLAWPWPSIAAADFEPPAEEFGVPSLIMARDDVALLLEVPSGGHSGLWVEEADGTRWQIGVRPLLPDELPADPPT